MIRSNQTETAQADSLIDSQDYADAVVPLSERRGALTMGLLWLTMVAGLPNALVGFDWYRAGLTLPQVIQSVALSALVLLAYLVPSSYLGSKSGQTYALLSRSVFGRWGSWLVSINLIWLSMGWYGLNAMFLAEGIKGLYHLGIPTLWLGMAMAIAMAFNNFFGFAGIANFARYLAAPVLIVWVGYMFVKATMACPSAVLSAAPHQPFSHSFALVSSFVIGYSVWGNEADYWRYGKPKVTFPLLPLMMSISVGLLIFPVTGWMLGKMFGITDYASATALMNNYAFGGMSIVAAVVLVVTYFAVNDSGLYGAINAFENIAGMPRKYLVMILMLSGAAAAALFSCLGHPLDAISTLNGVFMPAPTVIMLAEWFVVARLTGVVPDFSRVAKFEELPIVRRPAVIATVFGCTLGVATSGLIPGTEFMHVALYSLLGWLACFGAYIPLRLDEHRRLVAERKALLEKLLEAGDDLVTRT